MSVLVILIGCSLAVALVFLSGFLWSVKSGQFEDTHTPGIRILFDDEHNHSRDRQGASDESGAL